MERNHELIAKSLSEHSLTDEQLQAYEENDENEEKDEKEEKEEQEANEENEENQQGEQNFDTNNEDSKKIN